MSSKKDETAKEKSTKPEEGKIDGSAKVGDVKPEGAEEHELIEEKLLEKMSETELIKKIDEFRQKSEENYDKYIRAKADIDNIIKRNKKEKEEWIKYSNETLIKDLLPVIDNLEKAIQHSKCDDTLQALRQGVEMTLKGLKDTLAKAGLEEVTSKGQTFDPQFHHAVLEQEDENTEAGKILNELQKGYCLNKRLIRPAMVVVSKGKPKGK
jgi:molecular chaperone GrpE